MFEVPAQVAQEAGKVSELERMVGQLTMQLEIAKKASKLLSRNEKVNCEDNESGVFHDDPVSSLRDQSQQFLYRAAEKSEDKIKHIIAALAAEHPTYGYRHITVMLNRQRQRVNNKRVLRLMRELNLAGKRPKRGCHTTQSNYPFKQHPN